MLEIILIVVFLIVIVGYFAIKIFGHRAGNGDGSDFEIDDDSDGGDSGGDGGDGG